MAAITTDAFIQIAFDQDIFDRLDDDGAGDDHRRHLNEWNMMYQFDQVHHRMMAEEEEEPLLDEKEDERVLSQRLSQLSTTSDYGMEPLDDGKRRRVSSLDSNAKKVRIDATHLPDEERIPTYLSIDQLLRLHMDMPMHLSIDDLQRVAFCMHQLNVLPIEGELWTGYLQCGTGLWREQSIPSYPHYWPHHVKSLITTKPGDRNEQGDCVDMVHRHLQEIRQQLARYQHEYDDKQRTRIAMTPTLESLLRELVHEQAVVPMRIKVDMALDVLRCDHEDHWLQFQYQAAMPTDYQVRIRISSSSSMIISCVLLEASGQIFA